MRDRKKPHRGDLGLFIFIWLMFIGWGLTFLTRTEFHKWGRTFFIPHPYNIVFSYLCVGLGVAGIAGALFSRRRRRPRFRPKDSRGPAG